MRRDGLERCILEETATWGGLVSCGGIKLYMSEVPYSEPEELATGNPEGQGETPSDEEYEEAELDDSEPEDGEWGVTPTRAFVASTAGGAAHWKCFSTQGDWFTLLCSSGDVTVSASTEVVVPLIADYVSPPDALLATFGEHQFVYHPLMLDSSGTITSGLYSAKLAGTRWVRSDEGHTYALLQSSVGGTELFLSERLNVREREGLVLLAVAARKLNWKNSHRTWYCSMPGNRDAPECGARGRGREGQE